MTNLPSDTGNHDWQPNDTHSAWKCSECGSVGFSPHPLPKDGCKPDQSSDWLDAWKPIFVNRVIPSEFKAAIQSHLDVAVREALQEITTYCYQLHEDAEYPKKVERHIEAWIAHLTKDKE